jgi:hypothetical protein
MITPITDWKERVLLALATCLMAGLLVAAGAIFGH